MTNPSLVATPMALKTTTLNLGELERLNEEVGLSFGTPAYRHLKFTLFQHRNALIAIAKAAVRMRSYGDHHETCLYERGGDLRCTCGYQALCLATEGLYVTQDV